MAGQGPWRLQIFCNFQGPIRAHGWSEIYWLRAATVEQAQADAFDLCNRRRLWYGALVWTVYAHVSDAKGRDTWAVPVDQINSFPTNLPRPQMPNDPWVGYYYASATARGRWGNRTWKGVPDDWISGTRDTRPGGPPTYWGPGPLPALTLGAAPVGQQRPLLLGPGQSVALLQDSLPAALVASTGFLTERRGGSLFVEPLDDCRFGAVSKRDPRSDQGWKRVSCEAGACCVGGYWVSADFSFCGQCVGVVRACYQAPCRWHFGGPVSGIRFYDVAPSNPLYLGRLLFGPKNTASGYWNTQDTGEITSIPANLARHFYGGYDVSQGLRDGSHADVTAQEAAGLPPWLLPAVFAA